MCRLVITFITKCSFRYMRHLSSSRSLSVDGGVTHMQLRSSRSYHCSHGRAHVVATILTGKLATLEHNYTCGHYSLLFSFKAACD